MLRRNALHHRHLRAAQRRAALARTDGCEMSELPNDGSSLTSAFSAPLTKRERLLIIQRVMGNAETRAELIAALLKDFVFPGVIAADQEHAKDEWLLLLAEGK